jgi:hypothetical protein
MVFAAFVGSFIDAAAGRPLRQGVTLCHPATRPAEAAGGETAATGLSRLKISIDRGRIRSGGRLKRVTSAGKAGKFNLLLDCRRCQIMIERNPGCPTITRALAIAWLVASTLASLAACDQFDTQKIVETCVAESMKHGEPFGNPKERARSEVQFRHYCAKAAGQR